MKRAALLVCFALAAFSGGAARADAAAAATAQARAAALLAAVEREGLAHGSAALQIGDAPPWLRPLGHARDVAAAAAVPATADTRYRIGSITKTMTAAMVMQLVEEGALRLDEPIARWFPALPEAGRITVEMLLRHRAGLGAIESLPRFRTQWVFTPRSRAEMLATITALPRAFAPGEHTAYNNAGYLLLAFIVEDAGGEPYPAALERRIVRRAGLTDTAFDTGAPGPRDALSYEWDGARGAGRWVGLEPSQLSIPHGAGGVSSTPRDLLRFMRALFGGALVRPETLATMLVVQDGYGLGLHPQPGPGPAAFGHGGQIDAFGSVLLHVPSSNTTLAWCGNAHRWERDALVGALRRAVFEPQTPVPSLAERPVAVDFAVEFVLPAGEATPAKVTLRGDAPPLSWWQGIELARVPGAGARYARRVELRLRDGVAANYKYLVGDEGWERTPNRPLEAQPSIDRVVLDDVFNHDTERVALRRAVRAHDTLFFEAFNARRIDPIAALFSDQLEFFHDRNGRSGRAQNIEMMKTAFAQPVRITRTLLPGDEVQPIGDFGAVHLGRHRFCAQPEAAAGAGAGGGANASAAECQVLRFHHIWQRSGNGFKLARVLSIDH
jgi:D-alanyl-D-alanine carboxypeptidase